MRLKINKSHMPISNRKRVANTYFESRREIRKFDSRSAAAALRVFYDLRREDRKGVKPARAVRLESEWTGGDACLPLSFAIVAPAWDVCILLSVCVRVCILYMHIVYTLCTYTLKWRRRLAVWRSIRVHARDSAVLRASSWRYIH